MAGQVECLHLVSAAQIKHGPVLDLMHRVRRGLYEIRIGILVFPLAFGRCRTCGTAHGHPEERRILPVDPYLAELRIASDVIPVVVRIHHGDRQIGQFRDQSLEISDAETGVDQERALLPRHQMAPAVAASSGTAAEDVVNAFGSRYVHQGKVVGHRHVHSSSFCLFFVFCSSLWQKTEKVKTGFVPPHTKSIKNITDILPPAAGLLAKAFALW